MVSDAFETEVLDEDSLGEGGVPPVHANFPGSKSSALAVENPAEGELDAGMQNQLQNMFQKRK